MAARRASSVRTKLPFDVDALWAIRRIGSPTLAPDGRLACAPVTSYAMDKNVGTTELWLFATGMGSDAGTTLPKSRRLTAGDKDSDPRWSPDGSRIAFTAKRKDDAEAQIYLIAPDGGEATRLTSIATGAAARTPNTAFWLAPVATSICRRPSPRNVNQSALSIDTSTFCFRSV